MSASISKVRPPQLAEGHGHIGGKVTLAVTRFRTDHSQSGAGPTLREHRAQQLTAHSTKHFCLVAKRPSSHDQFAGNAVGGLVRIGVVELLRQRPQNVVLLDEPQRHRRFAKLHAMLSLVGDDAFNLLGGQVICLTNDVADRTIGQLLPTTGRHLALQNCCIHEHKRTPVR